MILDSLRRRIVGPSWIQFQIRLCIQTYYLAPTYKQAMLVPDLKGSAAEAYWQQLIKMGPKGELFFWYLHWYRQLSNVYTVYALACALLPLEWLLEQLLELSGPGHCYLPGRFMLVEPMGRYVVIVMGVMHVGWRIVQYYSKRPIRVQLWVFLLHDEQSIRRVQSQVKVSKYLYTWRKPDPLFGPEESLRKPLHRLMYTQINEPRLGTWWRLRASRSLNQRRLLALISGKLMVVVYISVVIWLLVFIPLCVYMLLLPANHHSLYPGCREAGWSENFRWLWLPFDLMENLCIQLDTMLAFFCLLPLSATLNRDLMEQWRRLDARMRALRLELLQASALPLNPMKLERRVVECQVQVHDFFAQVNAVDQLMSEFVTTIVLLLVVSYVMMDYYFIKLQEANEQYIMLVSFTILFIVFTFYSFMWLTVQRATAHSYTLLCALMALDQGRFKRRFIALLDYYLNKNRCAYSLFRGQYAYLPSTYLRLIVWTISCATIINNLFKGQKDSMKWVWL